MKSNFWIPFVGIAVSAFAQTPVAKLPIPDDVAQKAAVTVIADVYKTEYDKAKTPAQKVDLAKKLLSDAAATKDDPVNRFVLFRVARDLASQQGDLETAFNAVRGICDGFETDRLQMQVIAAQSAAKAGKLFKDQQAALLPPLIDESCELDRYQEAKVLTNLALDCAKESRDSERTKILTSKLKEVEEISAAFEHVQAAKATLNAKPSDPAANLAMGKFVCLNKGDWKRGIEMLALGDDDDFKDLALLELDKKPDSLKLGDLWWKVSDRLEGTAKLRAQLHAGEWLRQALPGLSGLTKARVEKLLAQVPEPTARSVSGDTVGKKVEPKKIAPPKSPLVGVWGTPDGWRHEFLENGVANNITPKGNIDTVGKWEDHGKGRYSAVLGNKGQWEWKIILDGKRIHIEIYQNRKLRSRATELLVESPAQER